MKEKEKGAHREEEEREEEGREDDGGREWQGGRGMCSPRDDNTPLLFTCRCKMDGREGRPRRGIKAREG